ncbi:hypothetical protein QP028_02975 [Corynebacterium suedekumii]|nr:hypothetical protein QP028_02975 [Corynebacterium suedekumii]
MLRPSRCVLTEYDLGTRTPVGGEVGQRVQFFLGPRRQGRLLPERRNRRRGRLPPVLSDVLLDQPVLDLLNALPTVASGRATGELRDQCRRNALDLPAGVAVFAPVDGHPRHAE